jgi:hypothetical protein
VIDVGEPSWGEDLSFFDDNAPLEPPPTPRLVRRSLPGPVRRRRRDPNALVWPFDDSDNRFISLSFYHIVDPVPHGVLRRLCRGLWGASQGACLRLFGKTFLVVVSPG